MMLTGKNTISLLIGTALLALLFNPVRGILDIPHQSCQFTCILISAIIGIAAIFSAGQFARRLTVVDILFILLAAGSIYFYPPYSSLHGLAHFALIILYWSIRQTSGLNAGILYKFILVGILILSIIGYLQVLDMFPSCHPLFELTGPYGNPTIYAGMLSLLLSVPIIVLFHFERNSASASIYLLSIFTCIIALPVLWLTNCRSAWIAILAVIVYAIYSRFSISRRWVMLTFVLIALLSCWLYQFKPASANGRVLIWKVTVQMIKEKPLSGFGPRGFNASYMHYQGQYMKNNGTLADRQLADNNHYVYNEPLRWMVGYGIGGLLLYISIVYIILSYKTKEMPSQSAKAVCIAGLTWGFFSYPDHALPVLVVMTMALAEMSNRQNESAIKQLPRYCVCLKGIILLAIVGQGWLQIRMYQGQHALYQISRCAPDRSAEKVIAGLAQLESAMKNETIFWAYYCQILDKFQKDSALISKITYWERLYPSTHTYIIKGDALQRTGQLKAAEAAYWTAHFMVPSRQKARYRLALLYHRQGRHSEALQLAKEVLTEKVKIYGFETYEMHRDLQRIFDNQLNKY